MNILICKKCKKKFKYELVGTVYPGCRTQEDIICPYCGETNGYEMTSQFVSIEKIKEDKEGDENVKKCRFKKSKRK